MSNSTNAKLVVLGMLATLTLVGCRREVPDSEIVARVGDRVLERTALDVAGVSMSESTGVHDLRRSVESWVATQLLAQEAERRGLDDNPRIAEELRRVRDELLATEALRILLPDTFRVDEEEIRRFYEQNRESFRRNEEEVRLQVVVVSQASLAKEIHRRAVAGENVPDLASRYSEGPWKERGGDTGIVPLRTLPDKLRSRVARAKPGQVLGPQKLEDGYAIVKVVAKYEPGSVRELDEVRDLIELELKNQKYRKAYMRLIRDLSERTEVWVNEDMLRKADKDSTRDVERGRDTIPVTE